MKYIALLFMFIFFACKDSIKNCDAYFSLKIELCIDSRFTLKDLSNTFGDNNQRVVFISNIEEIDIYISKENPYPDFSTEKMNLNTWVDNLEKIYQDFKMISYEENGNVSITGFTSVKEKELYHYDYSEKFDERYFSIRYSRERLNSNDFKWEKTNAKKILEPLITKIRKKLED